MSLLSQSPQKAKLPIAASHSSLLRETKRIAAVTGTGSNTYNGNPHTNLNHLPIPPNQNHLPNLTPKKNTTNNKTV